MIGIAYYDENPGSLLMYEQKIKKSFKNRGFEFEFIKYRTIKSLENELKNEANRFEIIIFNPATNKLSGIKTANEIRKVDDKLSIVFIAENYEFVYEAFLLKASQYLVEDKDDEKLIHTLEQLLVSKMNHKYENDFIFKSNKLMIKLPYVSILYFEIFHRVIHLYTIEHKIYKFYLRFIDLDNQIDKSLFVKVFRSLIVNMKYISKISCKEILLLNGLSLPVSRNLYEDIKLKYENYIKIKKN